MVLLTVNLFFKKAYPNSVALAKSPVEAKRQSNRDAAMAKILKAAALKREQVCFLLGNRFEGRKQKCRRNEQSTKSPVLSASRRAHTVGLVPSF